MFISSTATTNPFGQSTSSPFGSQSVYGQNNNANNNPFTPKPFGGASPFGAQTGSSLFGGSSTGVFGAAQSSSPLASTPTFGASSSPAFGASSTPSFGSSVFGQKPAFGGFGSSPTQTAPFGSTAQQTQPAFGSNLFGSSTPFGASSQPSFGATSTPAFGTSSTPAFGAMSSPAFGSTSTPAFGYTTPAFGSTGTTFGASSAPAFGSGGAFGVSSTPAFGSSTTPSFGASSTPAFESSSTSVFGGSSTSAFGNASSPSFSFGQSGSAFGRSQFGTTPSPFGSQNSSGSHPTAPSFGNSGFETSSIGAQRVGSRVVDYTSTVEADGGTGKLVSLSAMPTYKEKSHEELRWEDYQSGNKGGPSPPGQSAGGVGFGAPAAQSNPFGAPAAQSNPFGAPAAQSNPFGAPAAQSNPFGATPTFGQSSSNPLSSTMSSKQNASSTPGFGASSSPAFGSSPFGSSQTTNLFGTTQNTNPFSATSASTQSIFGASSTPAFGASSSSLFGVSSLPAFGSSPSIFGSASAPATTSAFGSATLNFGNTQSAGLPATPSLGQTNSAFGKTTSTFGQSTAPSFGQSNLFNATSSRFGGNLFSSNSTPSTLSTSNQVGFGQTAPSLSAPFQPAQSAQGPGAMSFGNFGQTQAASSGFGGSSIFGQGTFGQSPANQGPTAMQPMPLANPFGTLPAVPQMSIGRSGSSPSIQYGISSMPVTHKPAPVRVSSLLTSRHLSQRRIRLPARKCHPKCDVPKVPFYNDYEEEPSTPKADALYIPRENPRALMIHPAEKWSANANMEKPILSKDTYTPVHENGGPTENGSDKTHFVKNNQKQNGCHEEHRPTQKVDSYITLTGHRAGEAAIVYEHGADIEALMPKLKHADYYTEPRIQELAAKERSESGFCQHVKDFVVGRHGYGSIKFIGETDVRRLDLEALVQFNNREVIVYMDDSKKPPVGQGLNKPAEVTLLNIKCFDKKTGQQYTEGPKVDKYKEVLAKKARDQGAEFVSYDPLKGEWKFKVNHFSKYNLLDEDDEGCLVVS